MERNFYKISSLDEQIEWLSNHKRANLDDSLLKKVSDVYPRIFKSPVISTVYMDFADVNISAYSDSWFVVEVHYEVSDDNWSIYCYKCDDEIGLFECLNYINSPDFLTKIKDRSENMKYIDSYEIFEKLKFNKQSKKKGAKTDTYNVSKSNKVIGQVKWSSRNRGYAFLPPPDCDTEIKNFVKDIMKKRRDKKGG